MATKKAPAAATAKKTTATAAKKAPAAAAKKAPAATTKAPTPAAAKAPTDRQASKAEIAKAQKKRDELVREFMASGIDFTPFTVDAGDRIEWGFNPDPMPAQTERLAQAMRGLDAARQVVRETGGDFAPISVAFDELVESLRDLLVDDAQKNEFPKPQYGLQAMMFFGMHVAAGRSGFPTKEA